MRAVLQRVSAAQVDIECQTIGKITQGWLVLLGVGKEDDLRDVTYMAEKTVHLRAFPDEKGKMNRSVLDIKGEILVVSQFTLYGDCRQGRRPGFSDAAPPEVADSLYKSYVESLRSSGLRVETGKFQAHMFVSLINEGPVTFLLDSRKNF
jgi:D-tyrosyl-tRNA(Tyr) deacylase